jgi:AcrR family transcriptional regulator
MERNDIIRKSFQLFRQHGIRRVTMDDIANDLGISKKTLYWHFSHKEELLLECVRTVTAEWEHEITKIKQAEPNPVLCIAKILRFAFNQLTYYRISWFQDIKKTYQVNHEIENYRKYFREQHLIPLYINAIDKKFLHASITPHNINISCNVMLMHMDEFVSSNSYFDQRNSFNELFNQLVLFGLKGSLSKSNETLLDSMLEKA